MHECQIQSTTDYCSWTKLKTHEVREKLPSLGRNTTARVRGRVGGHLKSSCVKDLEPLLAPGALAWSAGSSRFKGGKNKTQKEVKKGRARSQGPQLSPSRHKHLLPARLPSPECLPLPPPPCSLRAKTPGYKLIRIVATMGEGSSFPLTFNSSPRLAYLLTQTPSSWATVA